MIRLITRLFTLTLLFTALNLSQAQAQSVLAPQDGPRFFEMLDDVPLMPGLTELSESAMVFDKPSGRIIESKALSESIAPQSILAFYETTLPQLGWIKAKTNENKALSFIRQNEELQLSAQREQGITILDILIKPTEQ